MHEERRAPHDTAHHSAGEFAGQATGQLSRLLRQEIGLAEEDPAEKGRRAGRGGPLLGGAGAFACAGLLAPAGTAVAALSPALPVWAAAPTVTVLLFAVAGRSQLRRAAPPAPEEALGGVRADVEEIRERAHR
ncbi:phage holin family protein [Streptomyces sp. NPDC028635]|uniref:phage holin family protein n=1 Tax=Streptomyces sp. NPDC028635 TaxID=3154800 RepID=UPI003403E75B